VNLDKPPLSSASLIPAEESVPGILDTASVDVLELGNVNQWIQQKF
jgi:hypothetical protein